MRLAGTVIGILSQDHDPHLIERRQVERPEPLAALGEDAFPAGFLGDEEALQRLHIRALELARERCPPAFMEFDVGRHDRDGGTTSSRPSTARGNVRWRRGTFTDSDGSGKAALYCKEDRKSTRLNSSH